MHGQRRRGRSRHGGGREMRGWGPGRGGRHRVRRGDVRSAILALLDDRPMHGYEMIQELEERTGGRWRPSAGSIYPTLQLLEDEGLVSAEEVDGKRVFSLTDAGREAVPPTAEGGRPWEEGDEDSPRFSLRQELFRTMGAAKQVARGDDEAQLAKAAEILKDARKQLYGILAED
jgi:DNA-binding PadR family transcriptional regulator